MIAPQSSPVLTGEDQSSPLPQLSPERGWTALLGGRNGGHNQTSHHALLHDSFGYLVSKIVPGFFGLASVPVFVRLLGIEEYGRLSLLLPVLIALAGAGAAWLQQGILRFHPATGHPDNSTASFQRAVLVGAAYGGLGISLLLVPLLGMLRYGPTVWLIAEIYCAAQLIYSVRLSGLQARLLPREVARSEVVRSAASFLLPVLLVWMAGRKSFSLALLGLACGYAVPLAARRSVWHTFDRGSRQAGTRLLSLAAPARHALRQLWRFGWAVGAWLMLCQLLPVIGRSVIQRYAGYAQAGIYASLYELAVRSFSLFAFPVTLAAHPRIMRAWNLGDYAAARRTLRHAIQMQALLFLPLEGAGIVFARPLTVLITGTRAVSSSLLPLLMLGGFLWQTAMLAHKPLEIMQQTRTMLGGMLAVALCELTGNYLLVPRYGMAAAVYVYVFGALVYLAFVLASGKLPLQHQDGLSSPPFDATCSC
ncbi:MAG: lipopolysaccharide biosynthesis protein [Candidatus Sulfotelmatobacter sp.]